MVSRALWCGFCVAIALQMVIKAPRRVLFTLQNIDNNFYLISSLSQASAGGTVELATGLDNCRRLQITPLSKTQTELEVVGTVAVV
ncbi:hypothetical protein BYT27DRAFT_7196333 [Phlegmacium glaucopus]|nr:hypothetical protein BYT27DRAFT_7196333 [Phlegmacium glaucopus]